MDKDKARKQIGSLGEAIVGEYLENKGFKVVDRNYRKKWGEIDVIATKAGRTHFVEVKSVSCQSLDSISHETDAYRPEDNMHPFKLERLSRTIQSYLLDKGKDEEGDWEFDVATVYIDQKSKKAKVNYLPDVVL